MIDPEIQGVLDILTESVAELEEGLSRMERQVKLRDNQLAASTRRALDHANKIQELRIKTGIDVPNVPTVTEPELPVTPPDGP